MSIQIVPSHVAILVPSVRKAADYLRQFDFEIGEEEIWEGEGTKEIYVEKGKCNSLLLMESFKAGAYQRALKKRGPGLHHLAIDVLNLDAFIESISGSGWLLHPISLQTIKQAQTAYLARPGFSALIEVHERKEFAESPLFVSGVSFAIAPASHNLVKVIGLSEIVKPSNENPALVLNGRSVLVRELL